MEWEWEWRLVPLRVCVDAMGTRYMYGLKLSSEPGNVLVDGQAPKRRVEQAID